jgi:ADP-ribose pyrophosphatase YjhB (NUDIX family)
MIELITELQALAQSGIAFCNDPFDIERFKRILEISAELLSLKSNHKYEEILELFTKAKGYPTPQVDVRGAVFKDSKVLLVREKSSKLWTLPGGWADVNLSPSENVVKEIKEETGFDCKVEKMVGIFDKRKNNHTIKWPHAYKMFFLCSINGLQKEYCKLEIIDVDFFDIDKLPDLSLGRVNCNQIRKCYVHYRDISLKTEFD